MQLLLIYRTAKEVIRLTASELSVLPYFIQLSLILFIIEMITLIMSEPMLLLFFTMGDWAISVLNGTFTLCRAICYSLIHILHVLYVFGRYCAFRGDGIFDCLFDGACTLCECVEWGMVQSAFCHFSSVATIGYPCIMLTYFQYLILLK